MYNVLDLFSGIGGFSLGLERTGGFTTTAFCEICPKARKVLRKHWPDVPIYEDIKGLTNEQLAKDGITVDVITGGFPCQDISCAGKGKGIKAERSGLWSEMFRLIGDVRPTWAIIENVPTLRSKGLTLVLQNLCEIGMYAEWHCVPACSVGAPHQRDRIWIVAYPSSKCDQPRIRETLSVWKDSETSDTEPSSRSARRDTLLGEVSDEERLSDTMADPMRQHETQRGQCEITESQGDGGRAEQGRSESDAERQRSLRGTGVDTCDGLRVIGSIARSDLWEVEPELDRVAHGIPNRVDRLKQLGNSVVPQIPELIGNAILEVEV